MLRSTYVAMCRSFPGGTAAMAAAMGYTVDALRNRIYEKKGQSISVEDALLMQEFSGTKHFANEVARCSGGVFLEIPSEGIRTRTELLTEFNRLTTELGQLAQQYEAAVRDGEIDEQERDSLEARADRIHKQVERILAVSFAIYCREKNDEKK